MKLIKNILKKKWIKWLLIVFTSVLVFFLTLYFSVYLGLFGKVPNIKELSFIKQEEATQVLDKDGQLIGKFYIYDRQPLHFKDFPKHLIDALVATEDVRFYEHDGIDNVSLLRVFIKSILLQDKSSGGGSTITLQLAKNLYERTSYRSFSMVINKFRESIIAKRIEEIYSKEEILTMYLNTVPFSDNTYGIESAARKFFNKPAKQLNHVESATLIGTLKANSYYNPRLHPQRSLERRNVVLNQMRKYGSIPQDSVNLYTNQPLGLDYKSFNHDVGVAPYFRELVKKELATILETITNPDGEPYDLYRDGLIVHTTLDVGMQQLAEEAMNEHIAALQREFEASFGNQAPWRKNKQLIEAALKALSKYQSYKKTGLTNAQIQDSLTVKHSMEVFDWKGDTVKKMSVMDSLQYYLKFLNTGMLSVEPKTGAIRTYIGGIDYRYFKYDHISQSERQVGSTFKPFVYTAAIENGMKPCTYFSLEEVTYSNYDNWTPTNSGGETEDSNLNYNLEMALSNSVNTIAVKVLNDVGIVKVIEQAHKMGIKKELPKLPSIALGVTEINLKELAGAYACYVNSSMPVKPYCITKVTDKNGRILVSFKPEKREAAFSDYTRQVMLEIMKSTVNKGTASRLRSTYYLTNDIAGKTGTTQNNKDGWFVGITPNLVTVTWVGHDNHAIGFPSTGLGQGANSALPIFAKFYSKLNKHNQFNNITKSRFELPSDDVISDLNCNDTKRDGFLKRLFKKKHKTKKFKDKK
jgi:penicillin-binding protein 1A